MKTWIPALLIGLLLCMGCQKPEDKKNVREPCSFVNPIAKGQDPWVIKKGDSYYFIESKNGGLYVSKSKKLINIKKEQQLVWSLPDSGWNQANLWAPELHYYEGRWYIYYAASREAGAPFTHQRSGVLASVTDDPLGEYVDKGMLYTGDQIETHTNNKWAIDVTLLELKGQLYAIWSGWKANRDTDKTSQHLYIAKMKNPWTISSNRVKISSPTEAWEISDGLPINEGPQVLKHEGEAFIVYSASQSWLPTYKLGLLQLKKPNADPMNPNSWIKKGPIFAGADSVYGVGHASFTTSPDGTESWIVYHTKVSPEPGWNRVIHMQPFSWNKDGTPNFGAPVSGGQKLARPSGGCK